jgi:hypothetical protein
MIKILFTKVVAAPPVITPEKLLREEVPQRYPIEDIITHQFLLQEVQRHMMCLIKN